jgi:ribosomal protein L37E
MATPQESINAVTEECERCGFSTKHQVTVEILSESQDGDNAQFSREPYRISECQVCGSTKAIRMNNA